MQPKVVYHIGGLKSVLFTQASTSRFLAGLAVDNESSSRRAASLTSSTARSKGASLARDGWAKPESLRTNCSAEARISSSVAGGSKLNSVRILRHIGFTNFSKDTYHGELVRSGYHWQVQHRWVEWNETHRFRPRWVRSPADLAAGERQEKRIVRACRCSI